MTPARKVVLRNRGTTNLLIRLDTGRQAASNSLRRRTATDTVTVPRLGEFVLDMPLEEARAITQRSPDVAHYIGRALLHVYERDV